MLRRIMLAAMLMLNIGVMANVATAIIPIPECLPCPDDPPAR